MINHKKLFTVVVIFLSSSNLANAVTQGHLGHTSTGTINISITKVDSVAVSNVSDMIVPTAVTPIESSPVSAEQVSNDLCVYSTTGQYTITALGSNNDKFVMTDGSKEVPYNVMWNDSGRGKLSNKGRILRSGAPQRNLSNASIKDRTCKTGSNARLIVDVPPNNNNLSGSLTLIISPN